MNSQLRLLKGTDALPDVSQREGIRPHEAQRRNWKVRLPEVRVCCIGAIAGAERALVVASDACLRLKARLFAARVRLVMRPRT